MAVEEVYIDKYICDRCGKGKAVERGKLPPSGYHAVIMRVRQSQRKGHPLVRTRAVVFFCDKECFMAGIEYNTYTSEEIPNEIPVQAEAVRASERRYTEASIDRVRWGFAYGATYGQDEDTD